LITIIGLREIKSVLKPQNKEMNPIPVLRRNNCIMEKGILYKLRKENQIVQQYHLDGER